MWFVYSVNELLVSVLMSKRVKYVVSFTDGIVWSELGVGQK